MTEDTLIPEAAALVATTQFASTAMLQRKLRIGSARANRLMDELEALGVVGQAKANGAARDVTLAAEDLDTWLTGMTPKPATTHSSIKQLVKVTIAEQFPDNQPDITVTSTSPALLAALTTGPQISRMLVDAGTFTTALRAALPHAGTDPEVPAVNRVRINTGERVLVEATDRYSAIVVNAGMVIEPDGELWSCEILPEDAKAIVSLFKPAKNETGTLRIDATIDTVTITDAGGLFDGRALTVPRLGVSDTHPLDVSGLIGYHLQLPIFKRGFTRLNADAWRKFAISAGIYNGIIQVTATSDRGPLTVQCGDYFAGILQPYATSEEDTDTDSWINELPARQPHTYTEATA